MYIYIYIYIYIHIYIYIFNNKTELEYNRIGKISRTKHVFHITYNHIFQNYYYLHQWFKMKKQQVENIYMIIYTIEHMILYI